LSQSGLPPLASGKFNTVTKFGSAAPGDDSNVLKNQRTTPLP